MAQQREKTTKQTTHIILPFGWLVLIAGLPFSLELVSLSGISFCLETGLIIHLSFMVGSRSNLFALCSRSALLFQATNRSERSSH